MNINALVKIAPIAMIVFQCVCCIAYALARNWKMAVYWLAAAILNVAVIC